MTTSSLPIFAGAHLGQLPASLELPFFSSPPSSRRLLHGSPVLHGAGQPWPSLWLAAWKSPKDEPAFSPWYHSGCVQMPCSIDQYVSVWHLPPSGFHGMASWQPPPSMPTTAGSLSDLYGVRAREEVTAFSMRSAMPQAITAATPLDAWPAARGRSTGGTSLPSLSADGASSAEGASSPWSSRAGAAALPVRKVSMAAGPARARAEAARATRRASTGASG
mmetsp:Transcript_46195/g.130629  ORF Transcript_46195/g.130629 Transcript_46195/m.130629 type:complete len:220 (+) Transcript_46195:38-697(+)